MTEFYAMGYHIAPTIVSASDAAQLGLPVRVSQVPLAEEKKCTTLNGAADAEICQLFPRLSAPPTPLPTHCEREREREFTPHRLYRTVFPPSLLDAEDRSFAVVGAIAVSATGIVAEAVALWDVAWLKGHLDVKGQRQVSSVEKEITVNIIFSLGPR